jgi:small subunit ribosomal protein S8
MTDPIADYLTRIRNAFRARHKSVTIPASLVKKSITHILYEQGYIAGYSVIEHAVQGAIKIYLKYSDGRSAISGLGVDALPRTLNGLGLTIISTPKGVMTDAQARGEHVGGEVLCKIW